jgi:putative SOS response-associated peptidase YedK
VSDIVYQAWLAGGPGNDSFQAALDNPPQAPLRIYPVGSAVNSPNTDDPHCVEPVELEVDLFEKPWWD